MIQRGEGCVDNEERKDPQTTQRGEERVGNGLDRERVDVAVDVVNMPARDVLAFQVLLLKATPRWNAISGIQQYSSSEMQISK